MRGEGVKALLSLRKSVSIPRHSEGAQATEESQCAERTRSLAVARDDGWDAGDDKWDVRDDEKRAGMTKQFCHSKGALATEESQVHGKNEIPRCRSG